jgi:hypothetical protein
MDDGQKEPAVDDRTRILRCGTCGRTQPCSMTELMTYMTTGWSKCCGETMTLFIEAKLPGGAKS